MKKLKNWTTEYFGIYKADRIKNLHAERQAKAEGRKYGH